MSCGMLVYCSVSLDGTTTACVAGSQLIRRSLLSTDGMKYSHRRPRVSVSLDVTFQVSFAYRPVSVLRLYRGSAGPWSRTWDGYPNIKSAKANPVYCPLKLNWPN